VDVLSEVLGAIQLQGALYFHGEFTAPWSARTPASGAISRYFGSDDRVVIFHLLTEGRCVAGPEGGPFVALEAGDIVVFPRGEAHVLSNGAPTETLDFEPHLARVLSEGLRLSRAGGGGEMTRFVCGFLSCDARLSRALLAGLPPVFKVNVREQGAGQWLESAIAFLVGESRDAPTGGEAVLARLAESLFIETLRRHILSLPTEQTGWLAGLRDPQVGKALALLHGDPQQRWTLESLARAAGLSRTLLAERFRHFIGQSPMAYLMSWRLQLAARLLRGTRSSVAAIAAEVGYDSEAAFNRAFGREFGTPPARYRRAVTKS
jgi:AraC-like DNA-binding protein